MTSIKDIALFVEGPGSPEPAAAWTAAIAGATGASVRIVDVIEEPTSVWARNWWRKTEAESLIRREKSAQLDMLATRVRAGGGPEADVRTEICTGESRWVSLVRYSDDERPDLVVLSAATPTARPPFGSVCQHLFRKAPVPVLAVHPSRRPTPRRILVAVEPCERNGRPSPLALSVLRMARRLADPLNLELHVVHACYMPGQSILVGGPESGRVRAFLSEQETRAMEVLSNLTLEAGLRLDPRQVHVSHARPEVLVPLVAGRLEADLVVMGNIGSTGLQGLLIGSTAETLVNELDLSVLIVKPHDFVCPIRPV